MNTEELITTAKVLIAPGKGLLAADESTGTIKKRFEAVGLISTPELNRKYRQMLFSTPGIGQYLSGIIMFDETVRQKSDEGAAFPEYIQKKSITPGIKVDEGREKINDIEEVTKGTEGLEARLGEYKDRGLAFTKWRAPIVISDIYPSDEALNQNSERMAEYAALSQAAGLVPIVEPEVLLDGNHTTTRCAEITKKTLLVLFETLKKKEIYLSGLILKVNMVLPGKDSTVKAAPFEVAQATLRILKDSVPEDIGGIVFLSGGQTPKEATANLNEINKLKADAPWELSFSYARALQAEALEVWRGRDENVKMAQEAFLRRLKLVSLARQGQFKPEMEDE